MPYKPPKLPCSAVLLQDGFDWESGAISKIHLVTVLDVDEHGVTILCQAMSQKILTAMGAKRPAWYKGTSPLFVPWVDVAFIAYQPAEAQLSRPAAEGL